MCTLFPHRLENKLVCNGGCWRCKLIIAIDIDAKMRLFVHSNSHLTITSFGLQSLFVDRIYVNIYIYIKYMFLHIYVYIYINIACSWNIRFNLRESFIRNLVRRHIIYTYLVMRQICHRKHFVASIYIYIYIHTYT